MVWWLRNIFPRKGASHSNWLFARIIHLTKNMLKGIRRKHFRRTHLRRLVFTCSFYVCIAYVSFFRKKNNEWMNTVFLLRLTEKVYVHVNLDFKRQIFSKRDFIVAVLADVFRYCLFFIQENSANWYLLALLLFGCNWLNKSEP